MIAAYLFMILLFWVLQIIAYWRIFTKAGEPGWKSIIPVYCTYVQYKITWKTSVFWLSLILAAAAAFCLQMGSESLVFSAIGFVLQLASMVIGFISFYKLSAAFGHGIGYAIGLLFLYPIFVLILGFGSSEYVGNSSV